MGRIVPDESSRWKGRATTPHATLAVAYRGSGLAGEVDLPLFRAGWGTGSLQMEEGAIFGNVRRAFRLCLSV